MRNRSGFTPIEMALVTALVGLLSMMAYPSFSNLRQRSDVDAAKRQLLAQLATARSTAVQRGRRVEMRIAGNAIWLTASDGVSQQGISNPIHLDSLFRVTVSPTHDPVAFDSRGFAVSLPTTGARYVVSNATYRDSICVTKLGTVLARGCGL